MLKKTIKYSAVFLLLIAAIVFIFLNQFFGKTIKKAEVENYIYKNTDSNFKIKFFGTMCYYLEYKGNAILTDPFLSNPNPLKLLYNPSVDKKYLNLFSKDELSKIKTIVIGHAHYDHCLELPLFINNSTPVNVLGSQSLTNLFQKKYPNNNYIIGENYIENKRWFYTQDSSIRVFFIPSKHGPHFGHTVLMDGENSPHNSPPSNLLKWQCGKSVSYIIDFMDDDTIAKRIVFNGGKIDFPITTNDTLIVKERKADLIIIVGWKKEEIYSKFEMLNLFQPSTMIIGHWNNFFNTKNGCHEYIRKSELPKTLKSINLSNKEVKTQIMLPETLKE